MKNLKRFLTLIITLITCFNFVFLASSCKESFFTAEFICFSSPAYIQLDKNLTDKQFKEITDYTSYLESDLSTDIIGSSTYKFNQTNNVNNEYSTDFKALLTLCKDYYDITEKRFNVAVYPLSKLWKFTADTYKASDFSPPSKQEIDAVLPFTDFSQIDTKNFTKSLENIKVDLGGIAKGYALDKISTMLKEANANSGYVSIGSSSLYLVSTNGLSIVHPRNTNSSIVTINKKLTDTFVSTSGDYQRFYQYNNEIYSHVLDSKTGYPANTGIVSATIIGNGGAKTDAISTALCLMTKNEIIEEFSQTYAGYQLFAVYINPENSNDKSIITNINKKDFILHDETFNVIYI